MNCVPDVACSHSSDFIRKNIFLEQKPIRYRVLEKRHCYTRTVGPSSSEEVGWGLGNFSVRRRRAFIAFSSRSLGLLWLTRHIPHQRDGTRRRRASGLVWEKRRECEVLCKAADALLRARPMRSPSSVCPCLVINSHSHREDASPPPGPKKCTEETMKEVLPRRLLILAASFLLSCLLG